MGKSTWAYVGLGVIIILLFMISIPLVMGSIVQRTIAEALSPVKESSQLLSTQVSGILNPTPTIIPDPVVIINEIQSLARLETIQYTIEKVITAELGQGAFKFLLGDRLLFVAHGYVIAGIDLEKLNLEDIKIKGDAVYIDLPSPEIFVATLDNDKSYVYDREKGILSKGDPNLETETRKVAEEEIRKAAVEDGILKIAGENAENYLRTLITALGYDRVIFNQGKSGP